MSPLRQWLPCLVLILVGSLCRADKPVIGITMSLQEREGRQSVSLGMRTIDAIEAAGGLPLLLPPVEEMQDVGQFVALVDGFVFTGGSDIDPARYGREKHEATRILPPRRENFDLRLMTEALDSGKPVLAICLGMQEMNVARGGTLIQDIPTETDSTLIHRGEGSGHDIEVAEGSRLRAIMRGEVFAVNSYHHQAVDDLGTGLTITARSPDGIVEGIEMAGHPFAIGVQWHPEAMTDEEPHRNLFSALVDAAAEGRAERMEGERWERLESIAAQ